MRSRRSRFIGGGLGRSGPRSQQAAYHGAEGLAGQALAAHGGFPHVVAAGPRAAGEKLSRCFYEGFAVAAARRGRATRRVIASTIAAWLARPLPAMSSAEPCATEENGTGVPMVSPAMRCGASSLAAT